MVQLEVIMERKEREEREESKPNNKKLKTTIPHKEGELIKSEEALVNDLP